MKPKHILILTISFFIGISGFGQSLNFQNIGFEDALILAKKSKQIIFIQLTGNCDECDQVAELGLSGKEISDVFQNFVSIKVQAGSKDFISISKRYRISPSYPTSLFLNHEGYFLEMMYNQSTSFNLEYIKLAAQAMANKNNPPLASYTKKYKSGKYDSEFLQDYINQLSIYNFETQDLLEEHVGTLTVNSLFSADKIRVIIQSAPLIDSKVYKLMRFDSALYDSVFMAFPLEERIAINNRIINKSTKKAYAEKDEAYMKRIAYFVRQSHSDDYKKGRKSSDFNMLRFYKEVKDSSNYIFSAKRYYQLYLENLEMDSICTAEKRSTIETKDGRRVMGGKLYKVGNEINEMAWTVYEFSNDPEQLGMALNWSERILIYENPPYHDTYAHILYKIGAIEKAIEWQQKAVNLSDSLGIPNLNMNIELEKMKNEE